MRIDFRDPDIPLSHPPPPPFPDNFPRHFPPDISPSNIPIFLRKDVKDLYLLLRTHLNVFKTF